MIKKILLILVAALVLFGTVQTSQAVLSAVDPGPYTAATGFFPLYYTDTAATTLDLCLSKAQSSRVPGAPGAPTYMCTLLPNPGIFDDTLPMVFPLNWPDEAFWFTGDAVLNAAGVNLTYGSAVEAAFAGGVPAANDQVSFARIRIRADVPVAGTYIITHPYGVETFVVTTPGVKAINMTRDIGLGAPGVFTGALAGDVGPFLRSVNGPYIETNPDTLAPETFVGDPNLNEQVTGSPFGTNFVRVQGPGIDVQTDLFAVSGRIWNNQRPTAVSVDRSTYSRTAAGSQVDVFATSTATAALTFRTDLTATVESPMTGDTAGNFYGQSASPAVIPQFVIVTATDATTTPTPLASQVIDVVKITKAIYALDTSKLVVEASSSDQVAVPALTALGFGNLTLLAPGPVQQLVAQPVAEPPARITVKSANGGSDTEPVVIVPTLNLPPVAANDAASMTVGQTSLIINVLANDTDPDGNLPLAVVNVGTPTGGTALNNGTSVTFTPPAATAGVFTFTYQAADSLGALSNVATVTVSANVSPVAVNDTALTTVNTPVTINVLSNDSDPDGNLPLTVANVTQPAGAEGTVTSNGTSVTFTPALNFAGVTTFTYQVADSLGALSNVATVTVTVNDRPVANNDTANTNQGVPVIINLVGNDVDLVGGIVPSSVVVSALTPATSGTLSVGVPSAGLVTFAPAQTFAGTATFTYTVRDIFGATSNPATVTITVNSAPVAVNDTATTTQNTAVTILVLANDTGGVPPLLVTNLTQPTTGGTVTNNGTSVTFTPALNFVGTTTFTYRAQDALGALSGIATVTVTVTGVVDTITIKTAQYDTRKVQWNVNGSATQRVGNAVTIFRVRPNAADVVVASNVPVGANGQWQFRGAGAAPAAAGDSIRVVSTFNGTATRAVQVR